MRRGGEDRNHNFSNQNHAAANSNEERMSVDEKMELIDQEIRTLHHFFISKSFSPLEIEKGAQPFLKAVNGQKRKEKLIVFAEVIAAIVLLVVIIRYDPIYQLLLTGSRLVSVNLILPFWDWRPLYDSACFIQNPYFHKKAITQEDCEICESVYTIPRLANVTNVDVIMDDYILRESPFIVTDAMENWPAKTKFNIKFLADLYTNDPIMKDYLGCHFFSNIRKVNHKLLVKLGAAKEVKNYYAYWENCLPPASKVLRQFYSRPYFLPPGIELVNSNWVFVAQDYTGQSFKPLPIEAQLAWYAQIQGSSKLRIQPKPECSAKCKSVVVTLKKGEIFVATDELWLIDYSPAGSGDHIAIGAAANYD